MSLNNLIIEIADYQDTTDAAAIVELMSQYSRDEMGGGEEITDTVKNNLVPALAKVPGAFTVLAKVNDHAVGLINCFMGFSTFKAKPLINIHDVVVSLDYRGLRISQQMLAKVEQVALQRGCCKLTLEVLEGNSIAQQAYVNFGFAGYELDPSLGGAFFWQKDL